MKKPTKNNDFLYDFTLRTKWFLTFYTIFLILGLIPLFFQIDNSFSLWVNSNHSEQMDYFFKYITFLGDGIFYGIILIPLLFVMVRWSIIGLLSYSLTGIVAQILKHIFELPRPKHVFSSLDLNFVEGVVLYSNFSFPSGHTTSAFSLFLLLTFIIPVRWIGVIFFILALLVGFSRIYLMQHFYSDVYVGSILGVLFTIIILYIFHKIKPDDNSHWLNKPLHKLFNK